MKVGDSVVCKTFPNPVNGIYNYSNSDGNITIHKIYKVTNISHISQPTGLCMLALVGDKGICAHYWSDYFYSLEESRLLKINKLKEKINANR